MTFRRALLLALFLLALAAPAQASIVYDCQKGNLCLADDDGSDPVAITKDTVGYFHPSLSADGRTLATSSNQGTVIYDMVTRERTVLGGDFAFDLALSPDGKVVADNAGMCDCALHAIVCVSPIANYAQRLCDKQQQAATNGHDYGPDGRLYTAQSFNGGSTICRRAVASATCEATVVTDPAHYLTDLAVSPDGKRVVASSGLQNGSNGPIFVYDLTTGKQIKQLTTGAGDDDPVWTRNGKSILFARRSSGKSDIYTIAADGKAGSEELLIPQGSEPVTGPTVKPGNPGLSGFNASADGKGVKGKVLIPLSGSELKVTLKGGLGKLVKDDLPAGKRSFSVSLNKKGRKKLKAKGTLKVTLTVEVTPPNGGLAGSETKTLTLKD